MVCADQMYKDVLLYFFLQKKKKNGKTNVKINNCDKYTPSFPLYKSCMLKTRELRLEKEKHILDIVHNIIQNVMIQNL